jgi:hypothetical protein
MTPNITKNKHQQSHLAAPHTVEDTIFSGENEDTQMNEAPNENVSESITPSDSPNVKQASCRQSNQFALHHSGHCLQLWLITIFGNCGCVTVVSFLGVPSPLIFSVCDIDRYKATINTIQCLWCICS